MERLLVITSNDSMWNFLQIYLRKTLYQTLRVSSLAEGLEKLAQESFCALLLDIDDEKDFPPEAMEEIKSMNPFTNVILLLSKDRRDILAGFLEKGGEDFFIKPLRNTDSLFECLKFVCHKVKRWKQVLHLEN